MAIATIIIRAQIEQRYHSRQIWQIFNNNNVFLGKNQIRMQFPNSTNKQKFILSCENDPDFYFYYNLGKTR